MVVCSGLVFTPFTGSSAVSAVMLGGGTVSTAGRLSGVATAAGIATLGDGIISTGDWLSVGATTTGAGFFSRNRCFKTFPVTLCGNVSTNSTWRGHL